MRVKAFFAGGWLELVFSGRHGQGDSELALNRTRMTGSTELAGYLVHADWRRFLKVERWKGEMVERFPRNKLRQTICRVIPGSDPGSSGRGGKIRLPQRPEVSSKQATPLPLPNRFRQPDTAAIRAFYPR